MIKDATKEELLAALKELEVKEMKAKEEARAAKLKAEQEKQNKLKAERAARAKEVEDAFKAANAAQHTANELLKAFTKDYGSFHMSIKDTIPTGQNIFDWMLENL